MRHFFSFVTNGKTSPPSSRRALCLNIRQAATCSNKSCDLNQHRGPAVQTAPPPEEKRKLLPESSSSVFFRARLLSSVLSCGAQTKKNCHYRPKKASGGVTATFLVCARRKSTTSFFQWPLINQTPPSDLLGATLSKYLDVRSHQVINHGPSNTGLQFKRDACNGQI